MQVRHYSSGMYVRLGFAVAVNVDPDILLVDEVLSVGDEAFQRKCLERVKKFQREGRTILFVTHAADLVRRICDRAIVLDHGHMIIDGAPGEAVRVFRESMQAGEVVEVPEEEAVATEEQPAGPPEGTKRVQFTDVTIEHPGTEAGRAYLLPDESLTVRIKYRAVQPTDDLLFGIGIHDEDGNNLYGTNTRVLGVDVPPADGDGEMTFQFDRVPLLDGTYLLTLAIQSIDEGTVYDWREQQHQFEVMNPSRTAGMVAFPLAVHFE
jgi:ABC-2 type transport system ATP-binding protein